MAGSKYPKADVIAGSRIQRQMLPRDASPEELAGSMNPKADGRAGSKHPKADEPDVESKGC